MTTSMFPVVGHWKLTAPAGRSDVVVGDQASPGDNRGAGTTNAQPGSATLRARLGATRGGSPGIFGYTGGHGASWSPPARSRSDIASKGSIDCGSIGMRPHGSPSASTRAGTVAIVIVSGAIVSSSLQSNGVETCAPSRARTHHAPNTVLWGAFW